MAMLVCTSTWSLGHRRVKPHSRRPLQGSEEWTTVNAGQESDGLHLSIGVDFWPMKMTIARCGAGLLACPPVKLIDAEGESGG